MTRLDPDRGHRGGSSDRRATPDGVVRALAASPPVLRGAGAAVGIVVLLTARASVTGLFDEVVGLTLIAVAVLEQVPRAYHGQRVPWWRSIIVALAGVLIGLWPSETAQSAGVLAATAIAAYGITKSVQALASSQRERRPDRLARGTLTVALAIVVVLFPDATLRVVVIAIGLLWVLQAALEAAAIGRSLRAGADPRDMDSPHQHLGRRLARQHMSQADRQQVDVALFWDGADARTRLFRFAILMGLSTAIATFGIAADSTAVVIGAMLIAPLMTPILATASATLQGASGRGLRSAVIVLGAVVGAVSLAWILSAFIPDLSAVIANGEVTSRTAPTLLDLGIALAAGAAGAFAVTRADVSETLPGVAVAIALVPPLAVIGVTLYAGSVEQALGAALLFGTNLIAIVAMASIVFVLTGYVAWSGLAVDRRRVRASYATVAAGVIVLVIPLGLTTNRLVDDAARLRASQQAVDAWLGGADGMRVAHLDVAPGRVALTVRGPGDAPPVDVLHRALAAELGGDFELEVRVVPEVVHTVGGGGP